MAHPATHVLTQSISSGHVTHQVPRQNCILWSHEKWLSFDESLADWYIQCIKKCNDWKPGKLMSLHFYLLNLSGPLCRGLWGFSVPSPIIVFSLFAWESDTVSWKLGGDPFPKLFSFGKDGIVVMSLWIMIMSVTKLVWQDKWNKQLWLARSKWWFYNDIGAALCCYKSFVASFKEAPPSQSPCKIVQGTKVLHIWATTICNYLNTSEIGPLKYNFSHQSWSCTRNVQNDWLDTDHHLS